MTRHAPLLAWIASGLLVSLALVPAMRAWGDHDEHASLNAGDRIAFAAFVDQRGRRDDTHRFEGKTTVYGFVCTSCSLAPRCEGVSDAFAFLSVHLPRDIALVEVSFDPAHDRPEVLRAYARRFGIDPRWSFETSDTDDANDVERFAAAFGARQEPIAADATHVERITLVDGRGRIVEQTDVDRRWDATAFVNDARLVDGAAPDPMGRAALLARTIAASSPRIYALVDVLPAALFCLVLIVRLWWMGGLRADVRAERLEVPR